MTERGSPGGGAALQRLVALARQAELPALAAEAARVAERVGEGRFYVACVGQFKRGKSTLLNALIGEPLLPTGVVPVTSVVTVLRWGAHTVARVRLGEDVWQTVPVGSLAAYVSEEQNPGNQKSVQAVEVFAPAKVLESGMCLVDTPGVGSVLEDATRATRAFVPHIDAALVVLGADPPISAEELALVRTVAEQVGPLIFVLNKADRLAEGERAEAARFTEAVLAERVHRFAARLLEVSALEHLAGGGPPRDWDLLVARLMDLARESGASLVRAAEERASAALSERLLRGIDEQLGALRRPLEETERRVEALRRATTEVERSLGELHYLLMAVQERLATRLADDRQRFLAAALPEAAAGLRAAAAPACPRSRLREHTMRLAAEVAKHHLDGWLERELPAAEASYRDAAQRFVDLANGFLARFEVARDLGLSRLPPLLGSEAGFRVASHLFYTELLHLETPPWIRWVLDRVRSRRSAAATVRSQALAYLERLLASNSARIQNDLIDRATESRRQLEADIRSRLMEALGAAERALERARADRAAGLAAVSASVGRLEAIRRAVDELRIE